MATASTSGRCCALLGPTLLHGGQAFSHGRPPRPSYRLAFAQGGMTACETAGRRGAFRPCAGQQQSRDTGRRGSSSWVDEAAAAGEQAGGPPQLLQQLGLGGALGQLAALLALAGWPGAAGAAEVVAYNPAGGEEALKTLAGVGYIILVAIYFFRLFKKRAKTATSQPLASTLSSKDAEEDSDDEEEAAAAAAAAKAPPPKATPLNAFIGAAQAGVICYLLLQLCFAVDGYFEGKPLPEQYTAHNIAVLMQTVVRGLAYLITFIFGANALGLTGLTIQLLLFGDVDSPSSRPAEPAERLPDVSVTDDIFAIRRAFQEAERQGSSSVSSSVTASSDRE